MTALLTNRQTMYPTGYRGIKIDHVLKFKYVQIVPAGSFHYVKSVTMFDSGLAVAKFSCGRRRYTNQLYIDLAIDTPPHNQICQQCKREREMYSAPRN